MRNRTAQLILRAFLPALLIGLAAGCARPPAPEPADAPKTAADGKPAPLSTAEKRRYSRATEKLRKQQFTDAADLLEGLVADRPRLVGPRVNLALAYHRLERPERARETAEAALELDPESAEAHFVLGLVEAKQNHYSRAHEHYTKALELNPDSANTHYNLALLYDIYYQQPAKALPHYRQYMQLKGGEDEKTAAWINHLERSLNR